MSSIGSEFLAQVDVGKANLTFHDDAGATRLAGSDLRDQALRCVTALTDAGIRAGDRVGLLGPTRPEWAAWALATWLAGAALVPLQVPARLSELDVSRGRLAGCLDIAGARLVVSDPKLMALVEGRPALAWDVIGSEAASPAEPASQNTAVVQFTSGSTSAPKGVVVSHRAVLAQLACIEEGYGGRDHRILGWVPLFHDLGLFSFLVFPLLRADEGHLLATETFARRPETWLALIGDLGITATSGPQGAWAAALRAADRKGIQLDLSSLRAGMFAAEGVDPGFVQQLLVRHKELRLRPEALGSSYGLAEATLGVSATSNQNPIRLLEVDRETLSADGRLAEPRNSARVLVSTGRPLADTQVRIVDASGKLLPESHVGGVEVRSSSLMDGYLGGPAPFTSDGWLSTGDLGVLLEGDLYITGRSKDMMIALGQNYYPEDFEMAASRVPGTRAGRSVAVTSADGEGVTLIVEPVEDDPLPSLAADVARSVRETVGVAPLDVMVVARGTISKTTSGKLQRGAMGERLRASGLTPLMTWSQR